VFARKLDIGQLLSFEVMNDLVISEVEKNSAAMRELPAEQSPEEQYHAARWREGRSLINITLGAFSFS
jgi:hypothetical protein